MSLNYVVNITESQRQRVKLNAGWKPYFHGRVIQVHNRNKKHGIKYAIWSDGQKPKIGIIGPNEQQYLNINPHGGDKQYIEVRDDENNKASRIYPIRSDVDVYVLNTDYPWGDYDWSIQVLRSYNKYL